MKAFNWNQYILNYPELSYIKTSIDAIKHFKYYGQFENRTDDLLKEKIMITIITACTRPENLYKLKESIDFTKVCEWIIVYDDLKINFQKKLFENDEKISEYNFSSKQTSLAGHAQRNYALSVLKNKESYIYYLDDDNIIHPDFFKLSLLKDKIYTFNQSDKNDLLRLRGNRIKPDHIDTAMFLVYYPLVKDISWIIDKYNADGYYINNIYLQNKEKHIYINKTLCYYNFLN